MQYHELFRLIEDGARRYAIPVDINQLEVIVFEELQRLVDQYDLPAYVTLNDTMAQTSAGIESYPLPGNFGRLMRQVQEGNWGIYLYDGSSSSPLPYTEPSDWMTLGRTTTGRPSTFTLMLGQLWLNPIPDDNDDDNYTVQGQYVVAISRPDWEDTVLLPEPSVLLSKTLLKAAGSKHPDAQLLAGQADRDERALTMNHARGRMRLWHQDKHDRIGRGYGRG
jgi:hypothetical protein